MASKRFIVHRDSQAVLAELNRDGRGDGPRPERFYIRIGRSQSQGANFELKPEFEEISINTNTDNFKVLRGNRFVVNPITLKERLTIPLQELRARLKVGEMILNEFNISQRLDMAESITLEPIIIDTELLSTPQQESNNNLRNVLLIGAALVLL